MNTPILMVSFYSPINVKRLILEIEDHLPAVPIIVVDNNRPLSRLDEEKAWLHEKGIERIVVGPDLDHGSVIDRVRPKLMEMGFDSMIHIEPDCVVTGRQWYDNHVKSIDEGAWASVSIHLADRRYHPTPSAWNLQATSHLSWIVTKKGKDINDKIYKWLIVDENCVCPWLNGNWDTGQCAWYRCAREGKAAIVPCTGFRHLWGGSYEPSLFQVKMI